MRKVTKQISNAFEAHCSLTVGNTTTDGKSVWLHGNKIVERRKDGVYWTLAGWPTVTTRERVNGIAGAGVYQRNHVQCIAARSPLNESYDAPIDNNEWIKA